MTKFLPAHKRPLVIAHRGASALAPENTIAAFTLAEKQGADAIELDVRLTRDCEAVVFHNDKLPGSGTKICEADAGHVQRVDAGWWFTPDGGNTYPYRGHGLMIPTLDDVLRVLPNMPLIIELKTDDKALAQIVVDKLTKRGRLNDGSTIISSFRKKALKHVRSLAPDAPTGAARSDNVRLLAAGYTRLRWLARNPAVAFQLPVRKWYLPVTAPALVAMSHRLGKDVFTYTVNDRDQMKRFLDMGVDGIMTDYPHRLRLLVNTLK